MFSFFNRSLFLQLLQVEAVPGKENLPELLSSFSQVWCPSLDRNCSKLHIQSFIEINIQLTYYSMTLNMYWLQYRSFTFGSMALTSGQSMFITKSIWQSTKIKHLLLVTEYICKMNLTSLAANICLIQQQYTNQSKTYFYHLLKCFEPPITLFFAFLFKFQHLSTTECTILQYATTSAC